MRIGMRLALGGTAALASVLGAGCAGREGDTSAAEANFAADEALMANDIATVDAINGTEVNLGDDATEEADPPSSGG
jgi:hypothetical protein